MLLVNNPFWINVTLDPTKYPKGTLIHIENIGPDGSKTHQERNVGQNPNNPQSIVAKQEPKKPGLYRIMLFKGDCSSGDFIGELLAYVVEKLPVVEKTTSVKGSF